MKGFTKTVLAATAALVLGFGANAQAIPLTGAISITGGPFTPEDAGGAAVALGAATQIDFTFNNLTVQVALGDIAGQGILSGDTGVINDFSFAPLGGGISPLFSVTGSAAPNGTLSFALTGVGIGLQNNNNLVLNGTGTLSLTGFDPTPGTWTFTGNQIGGAFSWSSSAAAVPEPGTMLLMGSGLLGLGLWRRFKK